MEQFSLLPQMVENVTVTHKLLISVCPVPFSGLKALGAGMPQKCSGLLEMGSNSPWHQYRVPLPVGGDQSFHISPEGAFIWPF